MVHSVLIGKAQIIVISSCFDYLCVPTVVTCISCLVLGQTLITLLITLNATGPAEAWSAQCYVTVLREQLLKESSYIH